MSVALICTRGNLDVQLRQVPPSVKFRETLLSLGLHLPDAQQVGDTPLLIKVPVGVSAERSGVMQRDFRKEPVVMERKLVALEGGSGLCFRTVRYAASARRIHGFATRKNGDAIVSHDLPKQMLPVR